MASINLDFLNSTEQYRLIAKGHTLTSSQADELTTRPQFFSVPQSINVRISCNRKCFCLAPFIYVHAQCTFSFISYFHLTILQNKVVPKEEYASAHNGNIKFNHGTTTLGFTFKHGVLLAVDSRASMGSYIGSGSVQKVIRISKYLLGTMAGGAADCSYWERNLALQTRIHELNEGKRISVAAASKRLGNTVYHYRNYGLSMGTMIAGWDEEAGPNLYYIDNDGTRLKGERFSVGSGSTYAYGIMDEGYNHDMTVEQAVELGKRAIYHATHRDAYSGGVINVYCITEDGWTQHYKGDMNELHYGQYAEERVKRIAEMRK